ncbi:RNA polymerase sigma factor (plasmid) [Novosphingobium resinovorum]|uniref:RNA polymerase sigma factor n=1 Tax=Novosphingobium TaxID=165696 RepID=UPI001B3C92EE|nr:MULTISPECIES: RNA polymerase sigma factor [Novosphingobium]MBF7015092.1 RNA polymerase sigma factor [Novosphingobium sp. HR1a]WJM29777.1 RNA polymerase sigma factor [Novosphingobium resinovorum]
MSQSETSGREAVSDAAREDRDESSRFAAFYRREQPRLLRFFLRNLGNQADADELSQETLSRFATASQTTIDVPQAYLTRIATNLLRDHTQRGSTRLARASTSLDEGLDAPVGLDPFREVQSRRDLARWQGILSQLHPATLEIFMLNRVEGYSYREIAEAHSLPLWKVQKHMLKAIRLIDANRAAEEA